MKKKVICFFVCMLLITTTMIFVPKNTQVKAYIGEEEEPNEIGLPYNYLCEQINTIARVIHNPAVYPSNVIKKGRQFGSAGDEYTWFYIIKKELENMSLDDVHKERITHLEDIDKYYTSIIDIGGFNLTVNNESYHDTYGFSNDIPKSEVFPIACSLKKCVPGTGLTRDYTTTFENVDIYYVNVTKNGSNVLFNEQVSITDYYNYNTIEDFKLFGNLTYLEDYQSVPSPEDQIGRVYLFYENETNQNVIDNLTCASGCIIINQDKGINFDLSDVKYEVNRINQSAGENLTEILDNHLYVIVKETDEELVVYYDPGPPFLNEYDYFIITRIPDHFELANATSESGLLWEYANGSTPNLAHFIYCYTEWLDFLSFFPCCKGGILYSSFDHHIMLPTNFYWDEVNGNFFTDPNMWAPSFCVNYTLGNYLNETKGGSDGTKISGDINQDFHEEKDEAGEYGVDAHLVIANITVDDNPDDEYIIISNRYDGWWSEAPGDSGIGTAIVLATARHLKDLQENYSIDPKYDIMFLFTTGEEFGLRGAQYFHDKIKNFGDPSKIKMWIGTDQLGQNQGDLVLAPECGGQIEHDAGVNRNITWAIGNDTNYVERSNYDFKPSINMYQGGSEDGVWKDICNTTVFVKDDSRKWDRWHAAGDSYQNGDSLDYTDYIDCYRTFEMFWNVTKYYTIDPDCWFEDVTFTQFDSTDDADYLNDSIWVNYTINTCMPHDLVMINATLHNSSSTSISIIDEKINYTINSSGITDSIIFTVPPDGSHDNYTCTITLSNSTGRINEILELDIDGSYYNDTRPHIGEDPVYELYPYDPDVTSPNITDVSADPDTVGFGFNVTVTANVTDAEPGSGVDFVQVNISKPGGKTGYYSMTDIGGNIYQYVYSDTWLVGQYNYTIWAKDNANNSNSSSGYSFNVSANATINIATLQDTYGASEYINITDPPDPPKNYYLTDRGLTYNKYYNAVSGNDVLEVYTGPVNYLDDSEEWTPINATLEMLDSDHPAYGYGYRTGNNKGLYSTYFKPNVQDDWPVVFAYDKSDEPTNDVVRSKLVGMAYLDPTHNWEYEYIQGVLDSQGSIEDNAAIYEDVFTGTDVKWMYSNVGMKEEIILSDQTKTMLQNNLPSSFGLSDEDSYLVFITKFDFSGLDMYDSNGILEGNVTLSDREIMFKDDLGNFKCALPVGEAYELNNEDVRYDLIYRIIRYNGNNYLLSGLKTTDLHTMTFPVVIDPTLTTYSSSSDGHIYQSNLNYNTAWGASTGTVSDSSNYFNIGQRSILSKMIYRGFVFFNTSSIPSNIAITSATLSLYKYSDYSATDFDIVVQNGQPTYPHDPLVSGDYDKDHYSGNGGSMNTSDFSNGYNDISLTNYSWINEDGWTKLCLRSSRDISGIAPTGNEYVVVHSGNNPGLSKPKMIIEYRNQSKIKNTGSTNISGYLLIQVQYNDSGDWVVDNDTINETTTRTINASDQLALDLIFNDLVSTDDLMNGDGTYRVYTAFRDPDGDVLICDDETLLAAWYEFEVDTS